MIKLTISDGSPGAYRIELTLKVHKDENTLPEGLND